MTDKTVKNSKNKADEPANGKGRRDTMKKILMGGGALVAAKGTESYWKKPLVDSVILPAHATTSEVLGDGGATPV